MIPNLEQLMQSMEGLGSEVTHEVTLGDFSITMGPTTSATETSAYGEAQAEASEALGDPPPKEGEVHYFRISPAYILSLKQRMVFYSIRSLNGIPVHHGDQVKDKEGDVREVGSYLLKIVKSWPTEVIDYLFLEYNKLQVKVADAYKFTMTNRTAMSAIEQILRLSMSLESSLKNMQMGEDVTQTTEEPPPVPTPES